MAKASPKKKKHYKLKKTARRSIAAVFMITAIILAAIPVPEAVADDLQSTYASTDTSIAYPEDDDIEEAITDTGYEMPSTATPIATYEIQQNADKSFKKIWVYKIWLDPKSGIDKGVICDFNSQYNPTGGLLKIPNNVITEFDSFTMQTVNETIIKEDLGYSEIAVNAFFGIVPVPPDTSSGNQTPVLPEKRYKKDANNKWIDPVTLLEITAEQKRALYMSLTLKLDKTYVAREVITGTDTTGNTYEYIPFGPDGYKKKTEYEINAIGDNAFYDSVNGAKANHIQNLELQIVDSVVAIGKEAFRGAATLQKVTIGANVKNIGGRAFKECTALNNVTIMPGNKTIGVETFSGCNSLQKISFASTFERVDLGAFSNCLSLKEVDMSASTISGVEVGNFAFYNCPNLKKVSFATNTDKIGIGCFAIRSAQDSLEEIVLPQNSQNLKQLGNNMFDGQSMLKKVTMPPCFGYSELDDKGQPSKLNSQFFFKCSNLETVIFPENCKYATFPTDIFKTVTNPNFKVIGPATLSMSDPTYAKPRDAAHAAGVPYQYTENGVTYLELRKNNSKNGIEDGTYNFYRINDKNQLISFESTSDPIDLEILDKVGNYSINSIKDGCFSQAVKDKLRSVKIYDNSIKSIDANTFSNCPKLTTVSIGNSVEEIGANAFLECPLVEKISFATPSAGYDKLKIGADAFKTKSPKLTLQGDVVKNYAPFTWAMSDESVLDDYGTRVCYKSNMPQNITVIHDNVTGLPTLIDYPHFETIDEDNEEYKKRILEYFQKMVDPAASDEEITAQKNEIEAIVMEPYYIQNKLRVSMGEAPVEGSTWAPTEDPWYKITTEEQQLYDSIVNVVVPAGIESIDSRTFYDPGSNTSVVSNQGNWVYIPEEKRNQYSEYSSDISPLPDIHGGLFSGKFKEFPANSEKEKYEIGNDRLETITMYDVKSLPDYAFESCENLQKVVLGSALEKMGTIPFSGCTSLAEVQGNKNFEVSNKIIYYNNADGSKKLVECLPIRGLKSMDEKEMNETSDPLIPLISSISPSAFKDCAGIAEIDLTKATKLSEIPEYCFYNTAELIKMVFPDSIRSVKKGAFQKTNAALTTTIPTKQITLTDDSFEHNQGKFITFPDSAAWSYANTWKIRVSPLGERYKVVFKDYNGKQIGEVQMIEGGKDAEPPEDPVREGYVFTGWSGSYKNITEETILIAQYDPKKDDPSNPSDPNKPTTPTTTTSGGSSSNNGNNGNNSNSENKADGTKYKMTVTNGSGSGDYTAGTIVNITANASSDGKIFDKWTTTSAGVYFANSGNVTTSIVMPKNAVTVSATYKAATVSNNKTNSQNKSTSGNQSSKPSTSTKKTNTVITITKPGFSNTDKANAIVNGSTDNFVVKVTESAEAQAAIQEALLNSEETMDTIKYFPMDISLYDSTGTVKVTDTSGLSVNITMPLPDELKEYGGNNKVASVVDGQLEQLRPKFSTIDQVPCVTFTATHFSPYTIYVDTANLVAGDTQDSNPKTGDGIHPKWFLVIGLMAVSTILFLKKDRRETIAISH